MAAGGGEGMRVADDLWVFGYGSLIWNPGFDWAERVIARAPGYARSFCMWSIHHRGTPENPGLVLALDAAEGAECRGVAFRVPAARAQATRAYLRERELISSAYLEADIALDLDHGGRVTALAFVVDRAHPQYCGGLALDRQAEVIAGAVGGRGPNPDYLWNTQAHLASLGIGDADLDWLAAEVRRRIGPAPLPRGGEMPVGLPQTTP
jgi:cation transport protein ChaC